VNLRPARPEDEGLLLAWRNEPTTRVASLSADEITPEEHHAWFARKLQDPSCAILIIEEEGRPVGQVRLDRLDPGLAEVNIGLAPESRGRGLGREALRRVVLAAPNLLGVRSVKALVKRGNDASLASFAAAGFRVIGEHDAVVELQADSRAG
jgi:RimJ/RimL family protein N-acetyltransferase